MKKQKSLVRMLSAMMLLVIIVFTCSGLERAKNEVQPVDIDGEAEGHLSGC